MKIISRKIRKAIEEALYLSGTFVMSDAIPWLEWLDYQGHISAMKTTAKELDAVIGTWLEEHAKKRSLNGDSNGDSSDFMDVMLANLDEDAVMSGHSRDTVIKATAMVRLINYFSCVCFWIFLIIINIYVLLEQSLPIIRGLYIAIKIHNDVLSVINHNNSKR